jgi:diguanylate cyclase (GGDEF)-like protein
VDWSKLPDLAAVALLTCAFASVARQGQTTASRYWLIGWILISAHFQALLFFPAHGIIGVLASDISLACLTAAASLFMWAAVPYRNERSSHFMLIATLTANTVYVLLLNSEHAPAWVLNLTAALIGIAPLTIALIALPKFSHLLRWLIVSMYCALSIFLLTVQNRPGNGADLAVNGVLFTVYFGCGLHVWYSYRRLTAGALISVLGFFGWAAVFIVEPFVASTMPTASIQDEVWNLPKYIVAVGMILLLLEDQIEHNKYLALHDELTGLPNRRLFLDRLALSLERARRMGSKAALLVIDLDHFKQVNDSLGHHAGDLLLQNVSTMFSSRVRRSDTVARTGGDEFSLILEEPTNRSNAKLVAQSLMERLDEPMQIGDHLVEVGASIGVAIFPDDAADLEALCIAADLRMYDDKKDARGLPKHPFSIEAVAPAVSDSQGNDGLKMSAELPKI